MSNRPLSFTSDYMEGAHPAILERLSAHNLIKTPGYGTDGISASAKAAVGSSDRHITRQSRSANRRLVMILPPCKYSHPRYCCINTS